MPPKKITVGTRRSPLALAQAELAGACLRRHFPDAEVVVKEFVTQGDKKLEWSLEKSGGKGLFTSELEASLLAGEIDLAVHSGKDLPTDMRDGLCVAGCLPRARANDVLVVRQGIDIPTSIASGSPRRRAQAHKLFPQASFCELRGNVSTRLQKIADGTADATFLAAAGLQRLGISAFPGLEFREMPLTQLVPAAAQAAIALQCRTADAELFAPICDAPTTHAFRIERAFLEALGEGCHTAFAVHYADETLLIFREDIGFFSELCRFPQDLPGIRESVSRILSKILNH